LDSWPEPPWSARRCPRCSAVHPVPLAERAYALTSRWLACPRYGRLRAGRGRRSEASGIPTGSLLLGSMSALGSTLSPGARTESCSSACRLCAREFANVAQQHLSVPQPDFLMESPGATTERGTAVNGGEEARDSGASSLGGLWASGKQGGLAPAAGIAGRLGRARGRECGRRRLSWLRTIDRRGGRYRLERRRHHCAVGRGGELGSGGRKGSRPCPAADLGARTRRVPGPGSIGLG
jgi:hypothetical protein